MRKLFISLKNNIGTIFLLILLLILWQILQVSATSSLINKEQSKTRRDDVIRQESQEIIKQGDMVLLSTQNAAIQKEMRQLSSSVFAFDASDSTEFDNTLVEILDKYCALEMEQNKPSFYFIWTLNDDQTILEMSKTAREMNFLFQFQAVLPYEGSNVFAIDKVLRLQPRENLIRRYCEANKLAGGKQVMLIITADEFSPWIGSVKTGNIIWLANDATRQMDNSNYAVIDMPPLVTYDVYWLGQLYSKQSWTFENQDREAYVNAIKQLEEQKGIVLADREVKLSLPATHFVTECDTIELNNQLFRQMCLK